MAVPLRVILDVVPAADDVARQFRVALDARAHAKKGRRRSVLGELRQNPRRHVGVRTVIDGQGNAFRYAACAGRRIQFGPSSRLRGHRPAAARPR